MPFFTASISRRNHLKRARIAKAILRDVTPHNRTKSRLRLFRARAVLFAANFFSARCASSRSVFFFIGNEKFPIKKETKKATKKETKKATNKETNKETKNAQEAFSILCVFFNSITTFRYHIVLCRLF